MKKIINIIKNHTSEVLMSIIIISMPITVIIHGINKEKFCINNSKSITEYNVCLETPNNVYLKFINKH